MNDDSHIYLESFESTPRSQLTFSHNSNSNRLWKIQMSTNMLKTNTDLLFNIGNTKIEGFDEVVRHNEEVMKELSFTHIYDCHVTSRRIASLPASLRYTQGVVSTRRFLPAKSRFGPVVGIKELVRDFYRVRELTVNKLAMKSPVFLFNNNDGSYTYLNVDDEDKSNWLSLIKLGNSDTANIFLYPDGDELFALTTRSLPPRTVLAFGYAAHYLNEIPFVYEHPLLHEIVATDLYDTESDIDTRTSQCEQCGRKCATPSLLKRHIELNHMNHIVPKRRRKYRCRQCLHVFTNLFCLKRHRQQHCKQDVKSIKYESVKIENDEEEMKIPSDESFQNILDFSNSLLDLDRSLPNLDLSSSSKSDENSKCMDDILNSTQSSVLIPCRYCKGNVRKEEMRKHLLSCQRNRFNCECGQVFRNKEKLAEHVKQEHVNSNPVKQEPENEPLSGIGPVYSCDDCKINFKRRGMLMNHFWRKHPNLAPNMSSLPLLSRERMYLCAVCPKLYRSSTKRDRHMRNHHPGRSFSPSSLYCVETGIRTKSPSSCPLCVKEYASRAKMLQHMRVKHPNAIITQKSDNLNRKNLFEK